MPCSCFHRNLQKGMFNNWKDERSPLSEDIKQVSSCSDLTGPNEVFNKHIIILSTSTQLPLSEDIKQVSSC